MEPLQNASLFLIQVLFNLFVFVLLLRIVFQKVRVEFSNAIFQSILKITNTPLRPFRKYIPNYAGYDLTAIVFLLLLQVIKFSLLGLLQTSVIPNMAGIFMLAFADSLDQLLNLFFYAILIMVIMSWVNPQAYHPLNIVLQRVTEPLLQPVRRYLPSLGGFDLTPMVVMIGLKLLTILITMPLVQAAAKLL